MIFGYIETATSIQWNRDPFQLGLIWKQSFLTNQLLLKSRTELLVATQITISIFEDAERLYTPWHIATSPGRIFQIGNRQNNGTATTKSQWLSDVHEKTGYFGWVENFLFNCKPWVNCDNCSEIVIPCSISVVQEEMKEKTENWDISVRTRDQKSFGDENIWIFSFTSLPSHKLLWKKNNN